MTRWLLLAVAVSACGHVQPDVPVTTDACEAACTRGAELGCAWAYPTADGVPCEQVCEDTEATGWTSMHPGCVAQAESCEEASRVSARGCDP